MDNRTARDPTTIHQTTNKKWSEDIEGREKQIKQRKALFLKT